MTSGIAGSEKILEEIERIVREAIEESREKI